MAARQTFNLIARVRVSYSPSGDIMTIIKVPFTPTYCELTINGVTIKAIMSTRLGALISDILLMSLCVITGMLIQKTFIVL